MIKFLKPIWPFYLVFFILLNACDDNRLKIDISGNETNVNIYRLDQDLFTGGIDYAKHLELKENLGGFYKTYVEAMIKAGPVDDSLTINSIRMFINDRDIKEVYSTVASNYKDLDWLNNGLSNAFKHYNYYFPHKEVPAVTSYISGFNYFISTTDSALGIGLDMYLGKDCEYYKMLGYPQYRTNLMSREYIISDALKGWVSSEFDFDPIDADLVSQMVHYGKIQFVLDAVLPETPDSIKIGFSNNQLEWCRKNEVNIWSHFIDKNLLFSNNPKEIMKFVNEGPFTSGFPKESPARIGVWTGWQIVRAYMDKQAEIDLVKLMETDAQTILKESKYKPRW